MNSALLVPILLPTFAGLACLLLPKRAKLFRELMALASSTLTLGVAGYIFATRNVRISLPWLRFDSNLSVQFDLVTNSFGQLVLLGASFFTLLIVIYSLSYMSNDGRHREYYGYLMLTLGMTAGASLADNLIVLLFFWELVGVLLYALVSIGGKQAMPAANKTLIIVGAADLSMLLGIALLWLDSGTFSLSELRAASLPLTGATPVAAFLLILMGALAKAGAMPLHSWIPAIATQAPIPTMAILPASLDKLLGIYLLTNISLFVFTLTQPLSLLLMFVGALTIFGAVLMALIQHDYRKMLGFHAVSQVGYMVLGIGTGSVIGILGGLFHMLNHAIYKSCLFLCAGSVQQQTKRTHFADLGGMASAMPWTFVTCFIAALAISGVPPLNGFVSKWLIYQGILEKGGSLFPFFLLAAMFGSALTLASFMKLMYSIFWGDRPVGLENIKESTWAIRLPLLALALLCIIFGIFFRVPVDTFIKPILGETASLVTIPGIWQSTLATTLLALSLLTGFIFYLGGRARDATETEVFLGGEVLDPEMVRVPGTQFYGPIRRLSGLKQLYEWGVRGDFDLYFQGMRAITWMASNLFKSIDQTISDLYHEVLPILFSILGHALHLLNAKQILTYMLWFAYLIGGIAALFLPEPGEFQHITRIISCVGIFGWGVLALVEMDLKRFLRYAATSQFGFVVLGLTISWITALNYFISSFVAFLALIVCCRSIWKSLGTSEMEAMDGLAGRMPVRFIVFLVAVFWLSGFPPFGNFFSKYLLGMAVYEVNAVFPLIITAAALLTLSYSIHPLRRFLLAES